MSQNNFSSAKIKVVLDLLSRRFVKVWPLQTFISCNPLLHYEDKPFWEAIDQSRLELAWEISLTPGHFRHWFNAPLQDGLVLRREFECVVDPQETSPVLTVEANRDITLNDLLWADLMTSIQAPHTPVSKKALQNSNASPVLNYWAQTISSAFPQQAGLSFNPDEVESLSQCVALLTNEPVADWIDTWMVKWLAAYLDNGQAVWAMPNRHLGLRHAWEKLALTDRQVKKEYRQALKAILTPLPDNPYEALGQLLTQLGVSHDNIKPYLTYHLKRLPGWVGYMRWYSERMEKNGHIQPIHSALLADYLVIRLCYEVACCQILLKPYGCDVAAAAASHLETLYGHLSSNAEASQAWQQLEQKRLAKRQQESALNLAQRLLAISTHLSLPPQAIEALIQTHGQLIIPALTQFDVARKTRLLIETMEITYQNQLLNGLAQSTASSHQPQSALNKQPMAQVVFCIDVRSESFRKHLEKVADIETLGFAGFFGIPARLQAFGATCQQDMCPPLLTPRYVVEEVPLENETLAASRHLENNERIYAFSSLLLGLKKYSASTFAYVEAFGLGHAVAMILKTVVPTYFHQAKDKLMKAILPPVTVVPNLLPETASRAQAAGLVYGITLDEQVYYAEVSLTMIGLKENFSPLVILCGHGSQVENNPYASALDCGACGGNHGGSSAHILATILNNPTVKARLQAQGFCIPQETQFIAAEHNTTTDAVHFINPQSNTIPDAVWDAVNQAFQSAGQLNRQDRLKRLPLKTANDEIVFKDAVDWSQARPEWGLAGNAAMVIAPRNFTTQLDLEGRVFLHSYDWQCDPQGAALETILTAPLVVAEWINMQYFFSVYGSQRFGSGSKTVHNVVGQFGVMLGNASDLQMGLPLQSVLTEEGVPYHCPMRLTAVVQAPLDTVRRVIEKQFILQNLFGNQWVYLIVHDPQTTIFWRYHPNNTWTVWPETAMEDNPSRSTSQFNNELCYGPI